MNQKLNTFITVHCSLVSCLIPTSTIIDPNLRVWCVLFSDDSLQMSLGDGCNAAAVDCHILDNLKGFWASCHLTMTALCTSLSWGWPKFKLFIARFAVIARSLNTCVWKYTLFGFNASRAYFRIYNHWDTFWCVYAAVPHICVSYDILVRVAWDGIAMILASTLNKKLFSFSKLT